MQRRIRTRYAPSPTGFQHIGGIRTAIINYLVAKKLGGEFIIRIEDTDTKRYVKDAEEYILKTLAWLKIPYTEGTDLGGKFGPYRQSERLSIYKEYAFKLISTKKAYYAFDTTEALNTQRELAKKAGREFLYNYLSRNHFQNSFTLTEKEVNEKIANNVPFVVRLKLPSHEIIKFHDEVRGEISVHTSQLEDKILLKSDGWATYHLASVVDDTLMEISHVIRGEEWLPSAPIHHYLYEAFDWVNTKPKFAHLPLILNPDGDGKLSKRKLKNANIPIFPLNWVNSEGMLVKGMKEEGFLPDAILNILVLLGWHENSDKEIYARSELFKAFDFKFIQKSGAKFDFEKAKWINSKHIARKESPFLLDVYLDLDPERNDSILKDRLLKTIDFIKSRISTIKEIGDYSYLYKKDFIVNEVVTLADVEEELIANLYAIGLEIDNWDIPLIENAISVLKNNWTGSSARFYKILRKVLIGKFEGPSIVKVMHILGKDESLNRLKNNLTIGI